MLKKVEISLLNIKKYLSKNLPYSYHLYRQRAEIYANLPDDAQKVITNLSADDLCIDCGANIGSATTLFAKYGCNVIAFEPHPEAFRVLKLNTRKYEHVKVLQKAVVADDRQTVFLRFTDRHTADVLGASIGASISKSKPNLTEGGAQIDAINLANFIELQNHVAILKIDVEGYETELVPNLLESNCLDKVDHVFLETHIAERWPNSAQDTENMIALIKGSKYSEKFTLEWP